MMRVFGHRIYRFMDQRGSPEEGSDDWESLAVGKDGRDEGAEKHEDAVELGKEPEESEHVPTHYNHNKAKEKESAPQ